MVLARKKPRQHLPFASILCIDPVFLESSMTFLGFPRNSDSSLALDNIHLKILESPKKCHWAKNLKIYPDGFAVREARVTTVHCGV